MFIHRIAAKLVQINKIEIYNNVVLVNHPLIQLI